MEYDKNGVILLAIYCFHCSGSDHANMHGSAKSKGYCVVTKHQGEHYDFKCQTCGYENIRNGMEYIKDYAVR